MPFNQLLLEKSYLAEWLEIRSHPYSPKFDPWYVYNKEFFKKLLSPPLWSLYYFSSAGAKMVSTGEWKTKNEFHKGSPKYKFIGVRTAKSWNSPLLVTITPPSGKIEAICHQKHNEESNFMLSVLTSNVLIIFGKIWLLRKAADIVSCRHEFSRALGMCLLHHLLCT